MIKASSRPIINKRLHSEMIAQGFDYISLAQQAAVSDRTIYAIVHGETNPRVDTILLICRVLKKPLDYFYPLEDEQRKASC